jgi:hypothetical protein
MPKTKKPASAFNPPKARTRQKKFHYTLFVLNEITSPESAAIDRELQKIFHDLNQTYSADIHGPYSEYLQSKLADFLKYHPAGGNFTIDDIGSSVTYTRAKSEPADAG